ncbi:hypothetical protein N7527_007218, partial [Penicillium freii]
NQLLKALESLAEQSKPNIAKTAREFAVPVNQLRYRWKGGKSLFFNDNLMALYKYIDYFDAVGVSINRRQIAIAANSILEEAYYNKTKLPLQIGDH